MLLEAACFIPVLGNARPCNLELDVNMGQVGERVTRRDPPVPEQSLLNAYIACRRLLARAFGTGVASRPAPAAAFPRVLSLTPLSLSLSLAACSATLG